jgi:peroxiredoxin
MALVLLASPSLLPEGERQRAPEFALPDASGSTVRLADFAGKVVLINFWATWCVPCRDEIPWLIQFESSYKERGFAVIGISRDERGWAVVNPYAEKMGINYKVLLGDARTAFKYGNVKSLPATFLVDRQRRVAAIHFGLVGRKRVEQQVRELLAEPREEALQQFHALGGEHALDDLHTVVQQVRIGQPELAAHAAEAEVARAEDQPPHARVHQRARAHHARLERDIQGGVLQAVVAGRRRGLAERRHLGMGGGIAAGNGTVGAAPEHGVIRHQQRAHGHFAGAGRRPRHLHRLAHPVLVHPLRS